MADYRAKLGADEASSRGDERWTAVIKRRYNIFFLEARLALRTWDESQAAYIHTKVPALKVK